jgi:hypothetical protein
MNFIRDQQQRQHQVAQNNTDRYHRHPPRLNIVVLLESGASFGGTAVMFNNPNMPKCKIFFRGEDKRELSISVDINVQVPGPEKVVVLQSIINNQLIALHEEAAMEFPEWLEKHSTRVNESNPFFNLDEIQEEFKYKKSRFGVWRIAAQIGFFDDMRPQYAKFDKIVHLEIQELDLNQPN